ncbi:hypothetical protein L6164_013243 [Bauhinia variegata]|uniref:Uncharacterized protein n=1 Tax=Bauhinia variegata TaxID=167791 RepID=A0ACB9PCF6_BAUVA|nr:hypothetical protein L6164_013243 [Bauhinia variegata]
MQLQGEKLFMNPQPLHNLRPAFAFHSHDLAIAAPTTLAIPTPPRACVGPISVGLQIVRSEGVAALFSGVSATVLRQTLYSTTRMGLYDMLKQRWTDLAVLHASHPLLRVLASCRFQCFLHYRISEGVGSSGNEFISG